MGYYEIYIRHYVSSTMYTASFISGSTDRIVDRLYEREENRPAKLTIKFRNDSTVAAENMLSSSYAGWSDSHTAAVSVGQEILYELKAADFTTGIPASSSSLYMHGVITSLQQDANGILTITAYDYLKFYDYIDDERALFASIRDRYSRDVGIAGGLYTGKYQIESVDTTGAFPAIRVDVLTNDYLFDFGMDLETDGYAFGAPGYVSGYAFAQAFIPDDSEILGALIRCAYTKDVSATTESVIRVGIKEDDGSDRPVADYLFYVDYEFTSTGAQWLFIYFDTTNYTFTRLVPGKKYWLYVSHYSTDVTYPGLVVPYHDADGSYANTETDAHFVYGVDAPLDAGSSEGNGNLFAFPYMAKAVEISPSNYLFVTPDLVITDMGADAPGLKNPPAVMPSIPTSADRGRVSYYYSTIDADTVMDILIRCASPYFSYGTSLLPDTDSNITNALSVYRTRGKNYGDCLRELADLYSYVSGDTYQCSLCHRYGGAYHYISMARRKTTADTPVLTLAPGYDSATSNHQRIVDIDLRKTTTERPCAVMVVGRSPEGVPIYAKRDDAAYLATSRMPNTYMEYDNGITTLAEANRRAYDILDNISREEWEGTVRISGEYPNLFSLTSGTYGSGEIVTITHSKFGLSSVDFKVKAIAIGNDDTTLLSVTNDHPLTDNWIKRSNVLANRSLSFQSPDPETLLYVVVRSATAVTDTTTYMQLCQSDGTILASHSNFDAHRVLCTRLATPTGMDDYDTYTYHAEFAPENGYGTIERIELYSDSTGGSEYAEYDFGSSTEPYKTKYTKIVVDFHTAKS